jgi:hypothetical protein
MSIPELKDNLIIWKRWPKEYLSQPTTRAKWQMKIPKHIRIGSFGHLNEDNTPTLYWPLRQIIEDFLGKDGKTRVVTLRINDGTYKCSVTRVSPLPIK